MNNILKCISEFFTTTSGTPVGLCSFEHTTEIKKPVKRVQPKQKREMRLSELME